MNEAGSNPALQTTTRAAGAPKEVSIAQIFLEFLIIGSTSFGGVVPYLRGNLVNKRHWIDDKEFVEMLSISQKPPRAERDKLAVRWGEVARRDGLNRRHPRDVSPWRIAVLMFAVGIFYHNHGDHVWVTAALKGVAAAAVGLILSTVVGLSKKSLSSNFDFVFLGH